MENLDKIFSPRSIAIVGASGNPEKMSHWLIRNVVNGGFKGPVYPVGRREGEILGNKVYPSLADIPAPVDLVLRSVASNFVEETLGQAAQCKAGAVVILSSGFGEVEGEKGQESEQRLREIAGQKHIRLLGPNCLGIYNAYQNLNGTYFAQSPKYKGRISVVTQSGAFGGILVNEINRRGVGLGKLASIGNQIDVSHQELIAYFGEDDQTDVIGVYLEGVKDGPSFLKTLEKVSRVKPVVIFKAGRTRGGKRAAASHTGAMAGDFAIARAAFRQAGGLVADTTEAFFDFLFALAHNRETLPQNANLGIVTISGGPAVAAADYCEEIGLAVPKFSSQTRKRVREYLPFFAAESNPLDMTVGVRPDHIGKCVDAVMADPNISGVLAINWGWDVKAFAQAFVEGAKRHRKPVLAYANENEAVQQIFRQNGIVNFPAPERAVHGFSGLLEYKRQKEKLQSGRGPASSLFKVPEAALSGPTKVLDEVRSKKMLVDYGIPICREQIASSSTQLLQAAEEIGFPVVLKVCSESVAHKSEKGGVITGIRDRAELLAAAETIRSRFAENVALLVQEQIADGVELIVGLKRDDTFGIVMAFGLGGILAEVLNDVAFRVCPLSQGDALEMIRSLKGSKVLQGYRNYPAVDEERLGEILVRVSELGSAEHGIVEMDINPLIMNGSQARVVDALIIMGPAAH